MRQIVVKEWMTLDGIFDADTMDQWWNPYDSPERQKYILEVYSRGDVYFLGRTTYEMPWPFWSTQTDDEGPGRILNRMKKYVVSTTLKTAPCFGQ
jgi:RibD C-terminal domain